MLGFLFAQIVKQALPAAGVARLRDVSKKDFGKFVDDDNRWVATEDIGFLQYKMRKKNCLANDELSKIENFLKK